MLPREITLIMFRYGSCDLVITLGNTRTGASELVPYEYYIFFYNITYRQPRCPNKNAPIEDKPPALTRSRHIATRHNHLQAKIKLSDLNIPGFVKACTAHPQHCKLFSLGLRIFSSKRKPPRRIERIGRTFWCCWIYICPLQDRKNIRRCGRTDTKDRLTNQQYPWILLMDK